MSREQINNMLAHFWKVANYTNSSRNDTAHKHL